MHINDRDSIHTYSDYLRYLGNEKKAYLKGNVKLTDGKGTLTTPDLDYDLNTHIGIYAKTGKVISDKTVLTSTEGLYYGETKDVYFKKNVVLVNPDYTVINDTLLFNTYTNVATFTVPTVIKASDKEKFIQAMVTTTWHTKKHTSGNALTLKIVLPFLMLTVASNDSTKESEASGM